MEEKDPVECLRSGDANYFRVIDLEFLQNYRILAYDETCLSEAAAEGQLEVCKVIYERCPQHLYSVNKYGNTIFHHVAYYKTATTTMCEYFINLLAKAEADQSVESKFRMKQWLHRKNNEGLTAFNRCLKSDNITLMIKYWMQVDRKYNLEMLEIPDAEGNTALHKFVELMHLKNVELLLTAEPAPVYEKNSKGEIPLWIAMRLAVSTGNSNAAEIRRLILEKLPAQSTIRIGDNKWTALHQATYKCDLGAIGDIVRFCPSCVEIEDANGQNFLQIAHQSGHLSQVMHVLYRNNIVIQRPLDTIDQKKNTLMHLAVMQNEFELVKWLMPGECHIKYDPNADEETPLLIAMRQSISSENIEDKSTSGKIRTYLLEMNPTQGMICTTSKNWTPLQNAAHNGDTNSFRDIIKFCPDSIHVVDVEGRNFLHTSFLNGKYGLFFHALRMDNIVTTLLSQNDIYGKSPLGLTDDNMNTPFHLAVKSEDLQSVKQLSDASSNIPYGINSDGETPLMIAMRQARKGENTISVQIRKLILEKHPNQSSVRIGNNKWTSLHHAASLGEIGVVRDILWWCPNCAEIADEEGRNFLHISAEFKQYDVVKYVCDSNVISATVLNQLDRYGHTPLHAAAKTGIRDVILCLLYHPDVDKTTTNANGQKVLDAITFDYDKESAGVYGVRDRMNDKELKEQSDFDLVVGALIATVSFTAGITVPGGYISDGPNSGLALLANHAAFEAFAIANNLALVFSLYAVFSHFCTRHLLRREDIIYQLNVATLCTLAAIFSMMVAFIAGSCAVLIISKRIAITVSVTSACFFLFATRAICRILSQNKKSRFWKYCGFSSTRPPVGDSNSTRLDTMPV